MSGYQSAAVTSASTVLDGSGGYEHPNVTKVPGWYPFSECTCVCVNLLLDYCSYPDAVECIGFYLLLLENNHFAKDIVN